MMQLILSWSLDLYDAAHKCTNKIEVSQKFIVSRADILYVSYVKEVLLTGALQGGIWTLLVRVLPLLIS